jgi:hypothetical protein
MGLEPRGVIGEIAPMKSLMLAVSTTASVSLGACGSNETAPPADTIIEDVDVVETDVSAPPDVPVSSDVELPDAVGIDTASPADIASDTAVSNDVSEPPDVSPPDIFEPVPPCADIAVAAGTTISPPMIVTLSGAATTGDVARWRWSIVEKPAHAFTGLRTPNAAETEVDIAVAGTWKFRLEAWDSKDRAGCDAAEVTITATPTAPIHLELWWDDNTADPTAEIGADLDLHVMHPDAVGIDVNGNGSPDRWFDPLYDVAWHNPEATWPGPVDDPENGPRVRLLRRDDAGYGPEVITIENPRAGDVYTVGFHVWDDTDTQYLQPTEIRVYIDGQLRNRPNYAVPLSASKLERVMTIAWPFAGQQSLGFPFVTDGDMRPTSPTKD